MDLTELESQRYDRQIRVWGGEAQTLIQRSRVLVCGLNGLHAEVVKNIVLAGVNIVLQDDSIVKAEDLSTNFFVNESDIGQKTASVARDNIQQLNVYARIEAETAALRDLPDQFFSSFSAILVGPVPDEDLLRINRICRQLPTSITVLFSSGAFCDEAYFLADFGDNFVFHCDPPNEKSSKTAHFPSFDVVLTQQWSTLGSRFYLLPKTFVKARILNQFQSTLATFGSFSEFLAQCESILASQGLPPSFLTHEELTRLFHATLQSASVLACSVLGSILAQEVIKAVSRSGQPAINLVVFSSDDCVTREFPIAVTKPISAVPAGAGAAAAASAGASSGAGVDGTAAGAGAGAGASATFFAGSSNEVMEL